MKLFTRIKEWVLDLLCLSVPTYSDNQSETPFTPPTYPVSQFATDAKKKRKRVRTGPAKRSKRTR